MGQYIFDQYSLLHLAMGIVMYFWGLSLKQVLILHTIFETSENTSIGMNIINNYMKIWPGGKPKADSLNNILGDTISVSLGWYIAYYVDKQGNKIGVYNKHIKK